MRVTVDQAGAIASPHGVDGILQRDSANMDFLPWVDHGGIPLTKSYANLKGLTCGELEK